MPEQPKLSPAQSPPPLENYECEQHSDFIKEKIDVPKNPYITVKSLKKEQDYDNYNRLRYKVTKKMATKCEHKDRPHYSCGMCQYCYLYQYYQKRKAKAYDKNVNEVDTEEKPTKPLRIQQPPIKKRKSDSSQHKDCVSPTKIQIDQDYEEFVSSSKISDTLSDRSLTDNDKHKINEVDSKIKV